MQLFFLVEGNLEPIRPVLRKLGCSAFLPYEDEIGLRSNSDDAEIVAKVAQQKEDLGIDRIIITRDTGLHKQIGTFRDRGLIHSLIKM